MPVPLLDPEEAQHLAQEARRISIAWMDRYLDLWNWNVQAQKKPKKKQPLSAER